MKYIMLGVGTGQMLLMTERDLKVGDTVTIYAQNIVWSANNKGVLAEGNTYCLTSDQGTTHVDGYGQVEWFGITFVR